MPFDPDAYLAQKPSAGFDPDAYLAKKGEAAPGPSIAERVLGKSKSDDSGGLLSALWNDRDSKALDAVKEELSGRKYPGSATAQPNDTDARGSQYLLPGVMGPRGMGMLGGAPSSLSSFSNLPSAEETAALAKDKLVAAAVAGKGMLGDAAEKAWDFAKDQSKGLLGKAAIGKLLYDQFWH